MKIRGNYYPRIDDEWQNYIVDYCVLFSNPPFIDLKCLIVRVNLQFNSHPEAALATIDYCILNS